MIFGQRTTRLMREPCAMTPVHLERREPPAMARFYAVSVAINLVGRDRSSKASIRAKRKRAAWNDSYTLQLLAS